MKILVITQKIDENDDVLGFFTNWIKAISNEVEFVNVICLAKGFYNLPQNVKVVSLGKEHGYPKFIQAILFYIYAFKFLIKTDGIFIHMAPEYVKALRPLNYFFRKPTVMWYAHIKVGKVAEWAIQHIDNVLTPSKESFEYDSEKIISVGHGIDAEVFVPRHREKEADIISISRISKVKRIEILIEAMNILINEKGLNVTADIYGKPARKEDDEYLENLKYLVDKYNLEQYVYWKGSVPNKETPNIYASHEIFVRMQGGGGFGKTELEAMSMGLPAILPTQVYKSDLGSFYKDLYFPEDDARTFSECIERVLSWNSDYKQSYVVRARALVAEKHNIKNVAKEIVRLLNKAQKG